MKVMTWKTIDSAPKDGTYVLLHSKSAQYVGAFREGNRFEPQPWELAWRDGSGKFNTVTHWQPLPPPPSALVEGGEKAVGHHLNTLEPLDKTATTPALGITPDKPIAYLSEQMIGLLRAGTGGAYNGQISNVNFSRFTVPLYTTPPSRNDTIRECISVADNNYYEKLSAANRWFEQGDQGSAIVCRDQARACRDISTALRALLTDEVK